MLQFVQVFR